MTRVPRDRDSATCSAASRHTEQRMNRASPSFHSCACRSNVRGVLATVKFATAAPCGVNRSSGSAVRLPMIVMTVSPAMSGSFGVGRAGWGADAGHGGDLLAQQLQRLPGQLGVTLPAPVVGAGVGAGEERAEAVPAAALQE